MADAAGAVEGNGERRAHGVGALLQPVEFLRLPECPWGKQQNDEDGSQTVARKAAGPVQAHPGPSGYAELR